MLADGSGDYSGFDELGAGADYGNYLWHRANGIGLTVKGASKSVKSEASDVKCEEQGEIIDSAKG